jgi:MFS family permease
VVIVALPRMESDLGLGLSGQQWVVLAYTLALAALYLPSGALGDRIGLRRTFVAGVVLFAAASIVCALADTEAQILVGRIAQGVGGAVLTTTSLALLRVTWAGEEGRAIGLWTSLTSVATIGGPAAGGLIVDLVGWRWVFFLNVPFAAVVIVLALAGRAENETSAGGTPIDPIGSLLAAIGLSGVSYALVEAQTRVGALTVTAGVAGLLALVGLGVWTARARSPLVPLSLLRAPGLAATNVVTVVVYAALSTNLVFFPLYLQFLGFRRSSPGSRSRSRASAWCCLRHVSDGSPIASGHGDRSRPAPRSSGCHSSCSYRSTTAAAPAFSARPPSSSSRSGCRRSFRR